MIRSQFSFLLSFSFNLKHWLRVKVLRHFQIIFHATTFLYSFCMGYFIGLPKKFKLDWNVFFLSILVVKLVKMLEFNNYSAAHVSLCHRCNLMCVIWVWVPCCIYIVYALIHKCTIGHWDCNNLKCSHRNHYFHTPDLILIAAAKPWEKCHWPICLVKSPPEMNMWGLTMGTKSVWWFHSISSALTICLDNPGKEEIWHKCSHKSI